jgi:hypothetical protein
MVEIVWRDGAWPTAGSWHILQRVLNTCSPLCCAQAAPATRLAAANATAAIQDLKLMIPPTRLFGDVFDTLDAPPASDKFEGEVRPGL